MDKNFLFTNFCTVYSSKGTINKRLSKEACFGEIFHYGVDASNPSIDNSYIIRIYPLGSKLYENKQNNACLVKRQDIINHLRVLKRLFKFHYELKSVVEDGESFYKLKIQLNAPLIYHKYLLCWVRYLYEYPFNVFMLDAHRLKKLPIFKGTSLVNLFNLIGASSGINDHGTRIHAIGEIQEPKEFSTLSTILKRIDYVSKDINPQVNNIFKRVAVQPFDILLDNDADLHSVEYWKSEKYFKKRQEIYLSNYKLLKEARK
jgi:hypothetical protein